MSFANEHQAGRNHSERRNHWHNERPRNRDTLRDIAIETLQILDDGEYFPPGQNGPYNLRAKIRWTDKNTRYYGPDAGYSGRISESGFMAASKPYDEDQATVAPDPSKRATIDNTQTTIYVGEYSTLVGARKVHIALSRNTDPSVNKKIGVLNFASAENPGGGFINGSQGQVRVLELPYLSYMILT